MFLVTLLVGAALAQGQTPANWRKVGGPSVELRLASPATGPADQVWFSGDSSILYVRTRQGRIFRTADFQSWFAVADAPPPPQPVQATAARLPESGAHLVSTSLNQARIYALGRQLYRSEDGGHSWVNLTANRSEVVVGPGQRSVAVSRLDPDQVVVANEFGVWRSMDGGFSWSGLNQDLPNLAVRRILATQSGAGGTRVQADGFGNLELPPGGSVWIPVQDTAADNELTLRRRLSQFLGVEITAVGFARDAVYAGAADGRIFISGDRGASFQTSRGATGSRVERLFVDNTEPWVALAALSGRGPHILRTTNTGVTWDPLDGNLPDAPIHGLAAERSSGAVYVATDLGVFGTQTDLETASATPVDWTLLSQGLPTVPATDVRLDPTGVQLYASLDGYGVYAMAAPHRRGNLQIVNAADFSNRPAAPGSLLSVIGGRVTSVRGGNLDYPVLAVLGNDSQIQVPFEAEGTNVALELLTATGKVSREVPLRPVSPAILVGRDGAPMLWDADSGLALDARNTAHSNGRIQIWATGLGRVHPNWPTGLAAPLENPPVVDAALRVYLDGAPLQVTRATLLPGYIGFYLIEVQLPSIANLGPSELYVSADGHESNRVQLVLEP